MDPETKAEFEELQKSTPFSGGVTSEAAKTVQNFDLASWMAGSSKGEVAVGGADIGGAKKRA